MNSAYLGIQTQRQSIIANQISIQTSSYANSSRCSQVQLVLVRPTLVNKLQRIFFICIGLNYCQIKHPSFTRSVWQHNDGRPVTHRARADLDKETLVPEHVVIFARCGYTCTAFSGVKPKKAPIN